MSVSDLRKVPKSQGKCCAQVGFFVVAFVYVPAGLGSHLVAVRAGKQELSFPWRKRKSIRRIILGWVVIPLSGACIRDYNVHGQGQGHAHGH